MAHLRTEHGLRRDHVLGKAERPEVAGHVSQSHRSRKVPEVLEQLRPVGPVQHLLVFLGSDPRGGEFLGLSRLVDGRDRAVAGAGQRAGALDDLVQDGVDVEAGADASTAVPSVEMRWRSASISRRRSSGWCNGSPSAGPQRNAARPRTAKLDKRNARVRSARADDSRPRVEGNFWRGRAMVAMCRGGVAGWSLSTFRLYRCSEALAWWTAPT